MTIDEQLCAIVINCLFIQIHPTKGKLKENFTRINRFLINYTNKPITHSTHSSEETEFNWLYVARNSVPKFTTATNDVERNDKHRNHRSNTESMGIENVDGKK